MTFDTFPAFLDELRRLGELATIDRPVDPVLAATLRTHRDELRDFHGGAPVVELPDPPVAPRSMADPEDGAALLFQDLDRANLTGNEVEASRIQRDIDTLPPYLRERGRATANNEANLAFVARRLRMSPEEVVTVANDGVTEFARGRDIAIAIEASALDRFLIEGRYRTQHDPEAIRSTAATFDPVTRSTMERAWFGRQDTHPAYGYVRDPSGAPSGADTYGPISLVLREDVRSRTTVSVGDSLGRPSESFPGPLDDLGRYSGAPMHVGIARARTAEEYAQYLEGGLDPDDEGGFYRNLYVEAQVHGGVTFLDVDEVVFTGAAPSAQVQARLSALGMRWSVRDIEPYSDDARIERRMRRADEGGEL